MPLNVLEVMTPTPRAPLEPLSPPSTASKPDAGSVPFNDHLQRAQRQQESNRSEPSRPSTSSASASSSDKPAAAREESSSNTNETASPPAQQATEETSERHDQEGESPETPATPVAEGEAPVTDVEEEGGEQEIEDLLDLSEEQLIAAEAVIVPTPTEAETPTEEVVVEAEIIKAEAVDAQPSAEEKSQAKAQPAAEKLTKQETELPADGAKQAAAASEETPAAKQPDKLPKIDKADAQSEVKEEDAATQEVTQVTETETEAGASKAAKQDSIEATATPEVSAEPEAGQAKSETTAERPALRHEAQPTPASEAEASQTPANSTAASQQQATDTGRPRSSKGRETSVTAPQAAGGTAEAKPQTSTSAQAVQAAVKPSAADTAMSETSEEKTATASNPKMTLETDPRSSQGESQEFRSQELGRLSAGRSELHASEGRPDQLTHAERVRFVQRVANAFQMAQERGGELRLRLAPPELGQMQLKVQMENGVLSARLEVETAAARSVLLENMPQLRERLGAQDVKLGNFDVDLMDHSQEGPRDQWSGEFEQPRQERRPTGTLRPTQSAAATTAVSSSPARAVSAGGSSLNIVI